MQPRRIYERMRAKYGRAVRLVAGLLALALLALVGVTLFRALEVVTVRSATGDTQVLLTASDQPEEWLLEAGFSRREHDQLVTTQLTYGPLLQVEQAFPVSLEADGELHTGYYIEGTVADLLAGEGIRLGEHDYVEPALDTPLTGGTVARVHRVKYVEEVRREELDPALVEEYKAALLDPEAFIPSTNGHTYDILYRDKLLDGQVVESGIVELIPIIEAPAPRPQDSYTLQYGIPNSRIEGYDDIEFDPDGLPVNYTRVMQGAVATAYSASRGRGASGLGLYCGTVAVNPNVIPYGTRMWITDRSQNFIYGFAIATDTGTAMMEGHVDIDLFFETNAECLQFGKRQLDVYIFGPAPAAEEAADK